MTTGRINQVLNWFAECVQVYHSLYNHVNTISLLVISTLDRSVSISWFRSPTALLYADIVVNLFTYKFQHIIKFIVAESVIL